MKTIDLGNNESRSIGVVETPDGFLALTLSQSKTFRTRNGAEAWLARRGYAPNGERFSERCHDRDRHGTAARSGLRLDNARRTQTEVFQLCRGFDAKPRGYIPQPLHPNCSKRGELNVFAIGPDGQELNHTPKGAMCRRHAERLANQFAPKDGWRIEVRAARK